MPSKLDDTSNMHFLFACLEATRPSRVDFQEVAKKFNIRVAAARMRLRRLQVSLDGKQSSKVSKVKSTATNRRRQRGEKKTEKEGLETDWKGMEDDDDDDDDDDEEMLVRKSEDLSGKLKKEENNDNDNTWKLLPEAALPDAPTELQTPDSGVSHHGHAVGYYGHSEPILPLNPMLQQTTAQPQAQMLPAHAAHVDPIERETGQLPDAYTCSSAYDAMPQAFYNQGHLPNSQPYNAYNPSPWYPNTQQ